MSSVLTRPTRKSERRSGYGSGYRAAAGIPENARLSKDPASWVVEIARRRFWSKQVEIARSVVEHRYTAVRSAHDTGKSFSVAHLGGWWNDTMPDPFLVSTAPTWKQVNSILWRELRKVHKRAQLRGRINLDAEWYMGADELVGFGRKPADYDQSAFQGIHALNVLILIDEAGGVPKTIFDAADTMATNNRARVVAIGNPDDPASHFAKICQPGSGWNVIHISAFDTPAYTGEDVPDELLEYLVSKEWVEERKKRWGEGSPIYQSKVLGEFPEVTDDTVLSPKQIQLAQTREIEVDKYDHGQGGLDVARFGSGETALYRAWGGKIRKVKTWHKMDTMQTANMLALIVTPWAGRVRINVDTVGVGGGVYDRGRELQMPVQDFNAAEKALDPERFINRRAEAWWHLRELAEREELDLPPDGDDDELVAQLGSVKWKISSGGRIQIESKEDMLKRGMPSPDRADAAVMAAYKTSRIVSFSIPQGEGTSQTSGLRHKAL